VKIRKHLLLFLLLMTSAISSARPLKLTQLTHTAWTSQDGAPLNIMSLAQGGDGSLWIASDSGLYRFDGIHFTIFEPSLGDPQFPTIGMRTVCVAKGDIVWVSLWLKGIARIQNGHVRFYDERDGLPPGTAEQMLQAPDGSTNSD